MKIDDKEEKLEKLVEIFTTSGDLQLDLGSLSILYLLSPELREETIKAAFYEIRAEFHKANEVANLSDDEVSKMAKKQKKDLDDAVGFDVSPFVDVSSMFKDNKD